MNNDNNISKEIDSNKNIKLQNNKYNNTKKNWMNYPKTEPTDVININNNNNININNANVYMKISENFCENFNENANININTNNSAKNNIIINNQNLINCYINNNNVNNNNLNIYINKNINNCSNQNSYNNSNRNSKNNSNNLINVVMKSKNGNTPTSPNSNCLYENEKNKFEKDIIYDDKNKFEILEKNIKYVFNQYFQYYAHKNNQNKK